MAVHAGEAPPKRVAPSAPLGAWPAIVLALVGVLLPPETTAAALRGGAAVEEVVVGVWLFKGLLLLHAAILAVLARTRVPTGGPRLLELPSVDGRHAHGLIALAGIVVLAVAVRIPGLGDGLWYDEIETLVSYIRSPMGVILTTFDSKNQHMLFSLAARGSVRLLGESAWALRVPAMLFGVASVAALYWLGRLITGWKESVAAAAILAFSYHHVWFSQNARGYTGLLLWTLLGTGLLLQMLSDTRPRGWGRPLGYGLVMSLAMLTHATAVFVILSHALLVAGLSLQRRPGLGSPAFVVPVLGLLLAGTLTLQLHALVLPQFLDTMLAPTMAGTDTEWKSPVWLVLESLRGLQRGVPGGWAALAAGAAIGVTGLVDYWRQSRLVTAAMLLPLALTVAAIMVMNHNLWPRFFFFGAGFGVLIVVRGLFVAPRLVLPDRTATAVAAGLVALFVLGNAALLPRAWGPKQDFEGALEVVETRRASGDAVVVVDMTRLPYTQYLRSDWAVADGPAELTSIESQHARTWVVYTFPIRLSAVQPEIWARLQSDYTRVATLPGTVGSGEVVVMVSE
jgi:mannosyltransferase